MRQYLANVVRREAIAKAGGNPQAAAGIRGDADQEAWRREQRRRAKQHVPEALSQEEQRSRPTIPGGPAGPSKPGFAGAPGETS